MATFSKRILSGSTNGMPIVVTSTTSTGANTIHTAVSGTSSMDEIWLYAQNNHTADVQLTLEFGSSTSDIIVTIPYKQGLITVIPGLLLQNTKVLTAFAGTTNVITLFGYVNRIV